MTTARIQLLHLNGPLRGRTSTYEDARVSLGTAQGHAVRYRPARMLAPHHAEIEYVAGECAFYLRALDGHVFVNQQEVREVILRPNDLIELGVGGPKLRFHIHADAGRVCKPLRRMLQDAADVKRSSGAGASVTSLTRDLLGHATWRLRVGAPLLLLALVFGAAYLGGRVESKRHGLDSHSVEELRALVAGVRKDHERLASRDDLATLRKTLTARGKTLDALVARERAFATVLDTHVRSVGLVHGIYTLGRRQAGRIIPVRRPDGSLLRVEYLGSGFVASKQGHVLTNRHVAEPWWQDRDIAPLLAVGLLPTFVRLTITFPGHATLMVDPTTIHISRDAVDLAVFQVAPQGLVPLPMHAGDGSDLRGRDVMVVGYPTGINALLARTEASTLHDLLQGPTDLTSIIGRMAQRGLISPIITQGSLNEVRPRRLVYDALTTSGGSGGPVFGADGSVVGVNFAVTRDFQGSNFGVPIRFAKPLLR